MESVPRRQAVVLDDRALAAAEVVTFAVSRTWNPRQMGMGEDDRDLGVALRFSDTIQADNKKNFVTKKSSDTSQ